MAQPKQHAYKKALDDYEGRGSWAQFILVTARNYAYKRWYYRDRHHLLLSEIEEYDPELCTFGAVEDLPPDYGEIPFTDDILTILGGMKADPFATSVDTTKADRTAMLFEELVRACVAGYGRHRGRL